MTLRQYLLSLHDSDAEAAADLLPREVWGLDTNTPCGRDVCAMFAGLLAYCHGLDAIGIDEEKRWSLWSDAVEAAAVMILG